MFLPWALVIFLHNVHVKTSFTGVVLFALLSIILLGGNPAATVLVFVVFAGYTLFFFKEIIRSNTNKWFFIGGSLSIIVLLTLFITLPMLSIQSNPYGGDTSLLGDYTKSFKFNSYYTSFLNLFVLGGTAAWGNNPFYALYTKNGFFVLLGIILTILLLLPLFETKYRRLKLFFFTLIIFSLFFAKGFASPFGEINNWLFEKIPFLRIYRAVYNKFIPVAVFSYATLLGISVASLFDKLLNRYRSRFYLIALIPILILVYYFPFFTGKLVPDNFLTQIPDDYLALSSRIKDQSDYKILSIPPTPNGGGPILDWSNGEKYVGPEIDSLVLNKPVSDSYMFIKQGLDGLTSEDSWVGDKFIQNTSRILNYANIYNFKYVFLHKDFLPEYTFGSTGGTRTIDNGKNPERFSRIINQKYMQNPILNSSYFELYRIPDKYYLEHFYVPSHIIYSNDQLDTLFNLSEWETQKKYAILSDDPYIKNLLISVKQPNLAITKINQTKYRIQITGASDPYLLVFSESFNKSWKLYLNNTQDSAWKNISLLNICQTVGKKPIAENRHYLANSYANSWLIQPTDTDDKTSYELIIEFAPQKYFVLGLFIAFSTFLTSLLIVIANVIKHLRRS